MYDEELDERYLAWLYGQVASIKKRSRGRTHWELMRQIHDTIFVAFVPHDENRIADGRELRYEFLDSEDMQAGTRWMKAPCTMLELFIVLSRSLAFETEDPVAPWFWHLIEVLDLEQYDDLEYDDHAQEVVARTLDRVIWRTYEPDGRGGLFPLRNPSEDQRDVELWYQLNAYLIEQF